VCGYTVHKHSWTTQSYQRRTGQLLRSYQQKQLVTTATTPSSCTTMITDHLLHDLQTKQPCDYDSQLATKWDTWVLPKASGMFCLQAAAGQCPPQGHQVPTGSTQAAHPAANVPYKLCTVLLLLLQPLPRMHRPCPAATRCVANAAAAAAAAASASSPRASLSSSLGRYQLPAEQPHRKRLSWPCGAELRGLSHRDKTPRLKLTAAPMRSGCIRRSCAEHKSSTRRQVVNQSTIPNCLQNALQGDEACATSPQAACFAHTGLDLAV